MTLTTPTDLWLQTHSGGVFDLINPRAEDVYWPDIAASLAKLCRFNGHCRVHYSVAQHCILVAKHVPPEAQLYALLHDAHESYMGDIIYPVKRMLKWMLGGDGLSVAASYIDEAIFKAAGLEWPVPGDIKQEVKRADTQLLFAERAALMAPPWAEWTGENLYARLGIQITPWPWEQAEQVYLRALRSTLPSMREAE